MDKLSLRELPVAGKNVLMRVDFNVPLDNDLTIQDPTRILAALPSIKYVLEQGGALILMSHLGRPRGVVYTDLSLKPCAHALSALLSKKVIMAPDTCGEEVEDLKEKLKPGEVLLLENLRFHRGEENPDETLSFSKSLAKNADFYVNEAFACSHRHHASITEVPKLFPGKAAGGFLLEKEVTFLSKALTNPDRPFYAIIGGAKISTKMGEIHALLEKVDALLIGGGMAYTFLKARGKAIGKSLYEADFLGQAIEILEKASQRKIPLLLPLDTLGTKVLSEDAKIEIFDTEKGIADDYQGLDIGPKTIKYFCEFIQNAKTVLWNGPMGVYEFTPFANGTKHLAESLKGLKATTIVGGGDSIAALNELDLASSMTHVSTGGGATLEFIEYGTLPGIEALSLKESVNSKQK